MPRRIQLRAIAHDVLDSFVSRYNDIGGYWAIGQYISFLMRNRIYCLRLNLKNGKSEPEYRLFNISSEHYWNMILNIMASNNMPSDWLKDAFIEFKINNSDYAYCEISIETDLNRIFKKSRSILAFPHNPSKELRRLNGFGPGRT